jgi:FkbM family methyltransferase
MIRRLLIGSRLAGKALEPFGTRTVRVLTGPVSPARMSLQLHREKAYWAGVYERELQKTLASAAAGKALAYDVGANIGFFSLLLGRLCDAVVAVEATPETAARLRRNVELNAGLAITVVNAAVGERSGNVMIKTNAEPAMNAVSADGDVEVEATTLDELVASFGVPDIVKMDIEGAEAAAFRGASALLAARKTVFVLELHGEDGAALVDTLRTGGWAVRHLDVHHVVATPSAD